MAKIVSCLPNSSMKSDLLIEPVFEVLFAFVAFQFKFVLTAKPAGSLA